MSFEVLPIPENLRREELVVQLADRLKKLEIFNQTLFGRIEQKLTTIQSSLHDIDHRTEICRQKVDYIKNDNKKATVLYSHPRFPAEEIGIKEYFDSLFEDDHYSFDQDLKARFEIKNLLPGRGPEKAIGATHVPFDDDANVKSQFVIYDKKIPTKCIPEQLCEECVPWDGITSLSSLLLFNSSLNAYNVTNHARLVEQQKQSKRRSAKHVEDAVDSKSPTVKPESTAPENEELRIKLSFQSAPELLDDLPDALPSLSGLTDEFQFQDKDDSLHYLDNDILNSKNLPDLAHISTKTSRPLPTLALQRDDGLKDMFDDEKPLAIPSFSAPPAPVPAQTAPPPPPPPPALPALPGMVSGPPAPPPPPPPSFMSDPTKPTSTTSSAAPQPSGGSSRSSLLESIRLAGGRPKKTTIKEKKQEEKLKKKEEEGQISSVSLAQGSGGMDMLSELKNRLNSRRAGISAEPKKVLAEVSRPPKPTGLVDTIKSLIPEPSKDSDDSSSEENSDENEDWMD